MADKPRKISYQYACWRGTPEHLVAIARTLQEEIGRAAEAAKERAFRSIDESFRQQRIKNEIAFRASANLPKDAPLTPNIQAALTQAETTAAPFKKMQKENQESLIMTQAKRGLFGYSNRQGQFKSSTDPEFLRSAVKPEGISMRGNIFGVEPNATIAVLIQNRPWEAVSLEVDGDDPDWVSSAVAPLHSLLSNREQKVVKVLRNQWLRTAVGLSLWLIFIPPIDSIFKKYSIDSPLSVPVALILAAFAAWGFQSLTKAMVMTNKEPNAWVEISRAAISPIAGAVTSFLLNHFLAK